MTRVEELKKLIAELRESGAEPEDIAQVVQELNMELAKERIKAPQFAGPINYIEVYKDKKVVIFKDGKKIEI